MTQKKLPRHIGGGTYVPPIIEEATIQNGVATVRVKKEPGARVKQSLRTAFQNYCRQKKQQMDIYFRGKFIIIKAATTEILWDFLTWGLGIEPPKPSPAALMQKLEKLWGCEPSHAT